MTPSLRKIIWNDWPALFCVLSVFIIWIVRYAFPPAWKLPALPWAISGVALLALGWRVLRVKKFFSLGAAAEGSVEAVRIVKDRGRLEYSYEVEGRKIVAWCPVHKSKQILGIRVGQKITVLYDSRRHESSIVRELFVA